MFSFKKNKKNNVHYGQFVWHFALPGCCWVYILSNISNAEILSLFRKKIERRGEEVTLIYIKLFTAYKGNSVHLHSEQEFDIMM